MNYIYLVVKRPSGSLRKEEYITSSNKSNTLSTEIFHLIVLRLGGNNRSSFSIKKNSIKNLVEALEARFKEDGGFKLVKNEKRKCY